MRTRTNTLFSLLLATVNLASLAACAAGGSDVGRGDADDDGADDFGAEDGGDGLPMGTSTGDASGDAGGDGDGDGDGAGDGDGDGDGDGAPGDDPAGAQRVDGAFGLGATLEGGTGIRVVRNGVGVSSPASTGLLAGADHDARVWVVDGQLPTLRLDLTDAFGDPLDATAIDIDLDVYDSPALNASSLIGAYTETVDVSAGRTRVGEAVDWWHLLDVADSMWVQLTVDGDTLGDALELRSSLVALTAQHVRASGVTAVGGQRIPVDALSDDLAVVDTQWMSIGDTLPTVSGLSCKWIMSAPSFPRAEQSEDVLMPECAFSGHQPPPPSVQNRMGRSVLLEPYSTLCIGCTPRLNAVRSVFEVQTSCLNQPGGTEPDRTLELVERTNVSSPGQPDGDAPILVTTICQPLQ